MLIAPNAEKGTCFALCWGQTFKSTGVYNTRSHYTTQDKHQYRVSPKVTMGQGHTFTLMIVWVLFYFFQKVHIIVLYSR